MTLRFDRRLIVLSATLLGFGAARNARGQASDACWIQGNPSDVAGRASKLDSTSLALDGGTIKVCYGRPERRGRTIFGQLVPNGVPWRLGANEATAIHVPFSARVAGVNVAPGWYSLYAIPEAKGWRVVVNGNAQRWGIPINDAVRTKDIGSSVIPVEQLNTLIEAFTITLSPTSKTAATMVVEWESARVRIPVERR
ncbi:MAG TPA: DUF2911 domain-containing protein [Gemmatimonadaceae bacterium]|nr:DUF2911 domain-containing protein [Gemmatimonadaceae bacterium]